ncbi:bifunctional homocysteine S-methyltransferase/methylenetetrahydrofolate reductase [Lederbergia lenta]|uniref:Bifunctional homocysteine S-methyltransferase/5,10-methylenetetrahydrofolate reductase protein n=1 Tax=Lederbergia lenta TaxID=1467 RepID=A0A2X4WC91_LEDLE|nr:bifunctional homocysteine S-methyltransferase/methylenetetrahydrofolate reductase [Lederbergia lenta]MCM3111599.1 bifunctional homocysteine S-methyltransferase/methylenetetrahydrofolate reductase [Lederbergia lenta]MEC2325013.1 bifunctional homocysteine S-methyltransferase/methylenetetrahydrofolate reductase [Lederbergia lenta]SQI56492.1 bifunctional homocysteine S-methyltransferase/5,10-methylenetetrahydrofolate reductase protein [Lederbergia lenta]
MTLLSSLQEQILIGDGAMGTLLYSHGIDRCFEELNLTHPEEVARVHRAYLDAGSDVIQTNTYGANYIKLSRYGLEENVKRINSEAVRIARETVGNDAYVLGTIGGIHGSGIRFGKTEEIKRSFREQLYCLLLGGVDGLLLETYYDLEELTTVLKIAREETDLPIITNVSMHEPGVLENGIHLSDAIVSLEDLGANIIGVNCRLGPYHMVKALESIPIPQKAYLSVYPNASSPEYRDGKLLYKTEPDYFKKFARNFRDEGVRLIGGCCGTTPEHIRALSEGIKGLKPLKEKEVKKQRTIEVAKITQQDGQTLFEKVKTKRSIIVELDTPKHLDTKKFFEGARALKEVGIDGLTLADNSLASPRICNMTMASIVNREIDLPALVHITCRDRNLIGLQSHLMGLHTLGIRDLLAITGDPTKIGDFPGATSVYDVTSFELIKLIKQFNEGISLSGKSLKEKTNFHIATAFNPNVRNVGRAVERLEKKIGYGADYVVTQPVFSEEKLIEVSEATKHITAPIYIGIMPLVSTRNAEYLHNEVPGIKLPDEIRLRMAATAQSSDRAIQEGLSIAKELIDTAMEHFNGIYLITPFIRYDLTVELTKYIQRKEKELAKSKKSQFVI